MDSADTNPKEIERDLLERLLKRHPSRARANCTRASRLTGGEEALAEIRAAFADVDEEEIEREAVKAVKEVRREMAAERAGRRGA